MHRLPELPYAKDAFAPHLSAESFDYHHGKHHAGYVAKLNELLVGHPLAGLPLEVLVVKSAESDETKAIFNNAAQHWNHTLFWRSIAPKHAAAPAQLQRKLADAFGSVDAFKREFVAAGTAHFGSGWVWLVEDDARLAIETTANADTPIVRGKRALLACDLWEHAYYIDHRNARGAFLQVFVDHLADWEEAARRLAR